MITESGFKESIEDMKVEKAYQALNPEREEAIARQADD